MTDPEAGLDAIVALLEDADLIEPFVNEDGMDALRLNQKGAQVWRAFAIGTADADAEAVLSSLGRATMMTLLLWLLIALGGAIGGVAAAVLLVGVALG